VEVYLLQTIMLICYNMQQFLSCRDAGHQVSRFCLALVSKCKFHTSPSDVQGMTLNCVHIFIVTGSFLY